MRRPIQPDIEQPPRRQFTVKTLPSLRPIRRRVMVRQKDSEIVRTRPFIEIAAYRVELSQFEVRARACVMREKRIVQSHDSDRQSFESHRDCEVAGQDPSTIAAERLHPKAPGFV